MTQLKNSCLPLSQHALMEKNAALERHIAKQATSEGGSPAVSSDKPTNSGDSAELRADNRSSSGSKEAACSVC